MDKAASAEHRQTERSTYYFCSAQCAAAFDAEPARYGAPATGGTREGDDHR
ncbi:hypothetical protein ABZT43_42750 [Streptomyces sp. NPDC005349]|uniref:hypothetical protein n=1 Tax=Streptomyces sp. NPDC005349 TaxID=3157037 RepID=UPI0033BBF4B5